MCDRKIVRKVKRVLYHCSMSVRLEGCEIIKGNSGNCPDVLRQLCVPYISVLIHKLLHSSVPFCDLRFS